MPADRGDDRRIGDIQLGLVQGRQAVLALGLRLGALGGQYVDLALGHQKAGAALRSWAMLSRMAVSAFSARCTVP